MSEEEESNNEGEENEDEENEGEEKEDDEEGEEGEEKEDEEGEEKEDEEGEEEEDSENDKKKKKKKGKESKEEKANLIKFPESKLEPRKEIKVDLNTNNNNSNIFFNVNDITMANIVTKKTSLQILMEISADMDLLSSHLEKVLPPLSKYNKITNIPNYSIPISYPKIPNYDEEDLEIKRLINKANELSNHSIVSKKENENKEVKLYEDKGCQSEDEMENNEMNQNEEEKTQQESYNNGKNMNRTYHSLHNNFNGNINSGPTFYRGNNIFRRQPIIYTQPESNDIDKNRYQRYRPENINQAMNILLDKK